MTAYNMPGAGARAMKSYRCVFSTKDGRTTIEVLATDAERALIEAAETARTDADTVEIWDETGLVLQRKNWRGDDLKPPRPH